MSTLAHRQRMRSVLFVTPVVAMLVAVAVPADARSRPNPSSALSAGAQINCATADGLARASVRPVWFPSPQPPGSFVLNAYVQTFGPGMKWSSKSRYLFLGRVPGGANLGYPFPTKVADPFLSSFGHKIRVFRLAKVEGGRLYAEWPTARRYPDVTYAVGNRESLSRFIAFLRSLRRIVWPKCPATAGVKQTSRAPVALLSAASDSTL